MVEGANGSEWVEEERYSEVDDEIVEDNNKCWKWNNIVEIRKWLLRLLIRDSR